MKIIAKILYFTSLAVGFLFVLGHLGFVWWIFDLFSSFVAQYAIIVTITTLGLYLIGSTSYGRISLLVWAFLIFPIMPYYVAPVQSASNLVKYKAEGDQLRVMFYNYWIANEKYSEVADQINRIDPDIVIMAEMTGESYEQVDSLLPQYIYSSHYADEYKFLDFATFSKEAVSAEIDFHGSRGVPSIVLESDLGGFPVKLVGVHTSAPLEGIYLKSRDTHMQELAEYVNSIMLPVIVVGDFNATPFTPSFRQFVRDSGLYEARLGRGLDVSWPSFLPHLMRIPIDHALVSRGVQINDFWLGESTGSDHYPVIIDVSFIPVEPEDS